MPQDQTISEMLDYPLNKEGSIVTRRRGLSRMRPKLNAPPPSQPGSVDWTMNHLFGSRDKAIEMIESLVAGQGDNADEKWLRFVLLYRQWELQHKRGELEEAPTLNQVCHSLNFDARDFLGELQGGIQSLMTRVAHIKAAMAVPQVIDKVIGNATGEAADSKDIELHLRVAGVMDERGGMQINIQQNNNVLLKGEKEKMKSPLLQFSETVEVIDNEVREEND